MRVERNITRFLVALLATAMAVPSPILSASNGTTTERPPAPNSNDRAAIENLQRWVSSGHESWCKDARLVAAGELERAIPELSGEESEPGLLELDQALSTPMKAVFVWTNFDGSVTYRVTLERFAWLLPIAGQIEDVVWMPTKTERIKQP